MRTEQVEVDSALSNDLFLHSSFDLRQDRLWGLKVVISFTHTAICSPKRAMVRVSSAAASGWNLVCGADVLESPQAWFWVEMVVCPRSEKTWPDAFITILI